MEDHHLSRQERGMLAERLVRGLHGEPAEELLLKSKGMQKRSIPSWSGMPQYQSN